MSYTPVSSDPTDSDLYDFDHHAIDDANQPPEIAPEPGVVAAASAPEDTTKARSPYDILTDATGPQLPGGTGGTPYDILSNAINANGGPAQHPLTAEQAAFQTNSPSGSFTNPNPGSGLSVEQQAFQGQHPSGSFNAQGQPSPVPGNAPGGTGSIAPSGLPGGTNFITRLGDQTTPGGTPGAGATQGGGLPPQFANDPWAQAFYGKEGYFDPRFNTADSITQELLRGGSANWKQANELRGVNANVDAIVDAINQRGAANYFNSANAQQWGAAHNNQITTDVNNGVYGHNQAAIANVASQRVNPIANPIDQSHAELTNAMQQTLTDSLKTLGATGVHQGFDNYGNATIDYFNKSGQPESIKATFVDLANAIDQLRQRAAVSQPTAPPGGGGGGGYGYGGGGGRGGYAPPGGGGPPPGGYGALPTDNNRQLSAQAKLDGKIPPGITDYGDTNVMPTYGPPLPPSEPNGLQQYWNDYMSTPGQDIKDAAGTVGSFARNVGGQVVSDVRGIFGGGGGGGIPGNDLGNVSPGSAPGSWDTAGLPSPQDTNPLPNETLADYRRRLGLSG